MTEYVLNYLSDRGIQVSDQNEQEKLEQGIRMFLLENGINEVNENEYYRKYVERKLSIIDQVDLKKYFIHYMLISEVNQIVIEFNSDGKLSPSRKADLYRLMGKLHEAGLGEKYVPADEVGLILK